MPCINIKQHFQQVYIPIDKLTTVGYWVWKYKFWRYVVWRPSSGSFCLSTASRILVASGDVRSTSLLSSTLVSSLERLAKTEPTTAWFISISSVRTVWVIPDFPLKWRRKPATATGSSAASAVLEGVVCDSSPVLLVIGLTLSYSAWTLLFGGSSWLLSVNATVLYTEWVWLHKAANVHS